MYAASCIVEGNRVKSNLVRVLFMKLYIHTICVRMFPFVEVIGSYSLSKRQVYE